MKSSRSNAAALLVALPCMGHAIVDSTASIVTPQAQGVNSGVITVFWTHPQCAKPSDPHGICEYQQVDLSHQVSYGRHVIPPGRSGTKVGIMCGKNRVTVDTANGREHFIRVDSGGFTLDGQPQIAVLGRPASRFRCPLAEANMLTVGDKDHSVVGVEKDYPGTARITIVWTADGCAGAKHGLTFVCASSTLDASKKGNRVMYRFPAGTSDKAVKYICTGNWSKVETANGTRHSVSASNSRFLFDGAHSGLDACSLERALR